MKMMPAKICLQLFNELTEKGIVYCHWKSNVNILLAINGENDLDLLFDEKDRETIHEIFIDIGAVKFSAVKEKRYKTIEDYLAVDVESGCLFHFHVHYQLETGEPLIKSYCLPYAREILSARVKHPDYDIWTASPEWELLLLLIRQSLRIPPFFLNRRRLPTIGQSTQLEFDWLKKTYNREEFEKLAIGKLNPSIAEQILNIVDTGIFPAKIVAFNRELRPLMKKYRKMSHEGVFLSLLYRRASLRFKKIVTRLGLPVPYKRVLSGSGMIVCFIGSDGSGKSTIVNNLSVLFGKKMDVTRIYFGHGVSHRSAIIMPFSIIRQMINGCMKIFGVKKDIGRIINSIGVILDKKANVMRAASARRKGLIAICDRFPQVQFPGINDGPWLNEYLGPKNNFLIRWLARWEQRVYSDALSLNPELVIKIIVDPNVAWERKRGLDPLDRIKRKSAIVSDLRFGPETSVHCIENNSVELEAIQFSIANSIWNFLKQINAED